MDIILAVVKNIAVHERYAVVWAKHGIKAQRVDTMHEAIVKLNRGEEFFFVVISEDCIPDFMTQLPIMSDVSASPILVVTSSYTMKKKIAAMRNGAHLYVPLGEKTEDDVKVTFEVFSVQERWSSLPLKRRPALVSGDIILSLSRQVVLVEGTEVFLKNKEFEVLRFLMINAGRFLSSEQILCAVWGDGYIGEFNVLWQVIKRIRKSLSEASPGKEYIVHKRDVGYKFIS